MTGMPHHQIRVPGPPRLQCVQMTCTKAGVTPNEAKKMLALLGKRATIAELERNLKNRPPKFR